MTRRRKLALCAPLAAVLLLPGWRGRLEIVDHESVLDAARAADPGAVFGVARPGARPGEVWHAQYDSGVTARLLRRVGVGSSLPRLIPPEFVAHIPAGAERADGYFRVSTSLHWPWWRPGGGIDWHDPRVGDEGPGAGGAR